MNHLTTFCCSLAAMPAFALMEPATPESQGVSSAAILKWIDACEKAFDGGPAGALHGFVIVRHGKVIAEGSWKPFDTLNETHMLYSHSKSFTSTAIGFLVDEGKIDLDERVADIFADSVPTNANENVRQMRVRDLLTMNVGSPSDHMLGKGPNVDWRRDFFAIKYFNDPPGTGFRYDSDATYMLAAIVEKKSGERMMDYLKRKMFDKIGITKAWTTYSPEGIPCGGWGMNMTTREIARFGQLYLDRGKWNGEYILTPFWVDLASARHTWSGWQNIGVKSLGEGGDWEQGYGFQFWRCKHGAYRADGANGQYTIVMSEQDAVISLNAGLCDMQRELDLVWEILLPAMKEAPLPEDAAAAAALRDRLGKLAIKPLDGKGSSAEIGRTFEFQDNHRGFKSIRLEPEAGGYACTLVTRSGEQRFPVGVGEWRCGSVRIDPEAYEALGGYVGEHKTAASCGFDKDGAFHLKVYFTGDTGWLELTAKDGRLTGEFWAMGGCKLESK